MALPSPQELKKMKPTRRSMAKEAFKGSLSSAKEKFGRATSGFSLKDLLNPVKRARRTMAALGSAGDVVTSPLAGVTGLAQPEIQKGVSFAMEKTPEPIKKGIGKVVGAMSEEDKQFASDTLSASALFGLSGLAKSPVKEAGKQTLKQTAKKGVIRNVVNKTGKVIKKSGEKSAQANKSSFLDDIVRSKKTPTEAAEAAKRSKVVGPFRKVVTELSPDEKQAKDALMRVKNIKTSDTTQMVLNKADDELAREANSLMKQLTKKDVIFPKKELKARINVLEKEFTNNPFLTQNKSAIKLMLQKVDDLIEKTPAKGSELLKMRQNFDKWMTSQKRNLFDGDVNALKEANLAVRKVVNNFIDEKATQVAVKDSLRHQRGLFQAIEQLAPKAGAEAPTMIGRGFQSLQNAIGKNAALKTLASGLVIGGATVSGTAPVIGGAIGALATVKGIKTLLANPQNRITLGKLLQEISQASAKQTALASVPELNALKQRIQQAINETPTDIKPKSSNIDPKQALRALGIQ